VVAQSSQGDLIQAIGTGSVELGTAMTANGGEFAFWAGRVVDGVSSTRLMAVTSYVGTGAASRTIALNLSGSTPALAFVVPTNNSTKVYRVTSDTTGRAMLSGDAVANAITG
jgi:hypothetical protein